MWSLETKLLGRVTCCVTYHMITPNMVSESKCVTACTQTKEANMHSFELSSAFIKSSSPQLRLYQEDETRLGVKAEQ